MIPVHNELSPVWLTVTEMTGTNRRKSPYNMLNKTKFLQVPKPAREEKRKLTRQNDETPDFSGVSDFSGPYRIVVPVEMAGLDI